MIRPLDRVLIALAVAAVVGAVALGTPMQAGPDEPAHLIRAAGVVRGDVFGTADPDGEAYRTFTVPVWVGQPDPGCFAFRPDTSASCAVPADTGGDADLVSSAASYPPWPHLLPGLATLAPGGSWTLWLARLLAALPGAVLIIFGLLRIQRIGSPLLWAAGLVALTPAAVFATSVVNPSGAAVGGAFAATVAVCAHRRSDPPDWLFVGGIVALALSRSDGAVWAVLVALVAAFASSTDPRELWRRSTTAQRAVLGGSIALSVIWAAAVRPELIAVPTEARGMALVTLAIGRIGRHLEEGVGQFSWADTTIPVTASYVWWLVVGALAATAIIGRERRRAVVAGVGLAGFVAIGLVADVVSGPSSGLVWQGRYSLPLLIASVVALGAGRAKRADREIAVVVSTAVVGIWVASFWQALRRWGSGQAGTLYPWRWDMGPAALPPIVTLALVVTGSVILWKAVPIAPSDEPDADGEDR